MDGRDKVDLVWKRFVHRTDAFVYQWYDADRKEGGYWPFKVNGEYVGLTKDHIARHLKGTNTYGVYQLDTESTVKWLCFDVDIEKDSEGTVEQVQQRTLALARLIRRHFGPRFLVEQSGSKGYHIWLFFDQPIPALYASAVGKYLESTLPSEVGVHVEVFPKQTQVRNFGNLVKIPLGVHKKTGNRCLFVNGAFEPLDDQWGALESVKTVSLEDLQKIIREYNINLDELVVRADASESPGGLPCMMRMMAEGFKDGTRDRGMFTLACYLRYHGYPYDIAHGILTHVNERNVDGLDDQVILQKLESAYSAAYSPFPCSDRVLDSYCSSSCRFFANKVKDRWTRYGKDPTTAVGVISRD